MEQKIKQMYQDSLRLDSEEKIKQLEKLKIICDDTEDYLYLYLVNFELMKEYKKLGNNYRSIVLYESNIQICLKNNYDPSGLFDEFPWASRNIDSVLNIHQKEINDFFINMRKIFEVHSRSLRSYYQEYYSYLMRVGRWEEGFSNYSKWMVESRNGFSQSIGKEEADRTFYYFSVGDYQNAKYVFETVKKGLESPPGTRSYAYPRAAKYYLELKDWEMTSYLIQRGYEYNKNSIEKIEEVAEILKPLSILNPKIALKIWIKHRYHFKLTDNQRAKFSFGISAYLLDKTLGVYLSGTRRRHKLNENIKDMYDIQSWMDERNGTDSYHEELMYWSELWKNFQ